MGSYRVCGCFTRSFRAAEAGPPADVRVVFDKYTGGGTHMTAEQLLRFLAEEQGEEGATAVDADRVVEEVVRQCHHITRFTRNSLTLEDFFYSLFSPHLNPPIFSKVYQDMTAPMSHYFIYTGHNSYLTGNQLSSDCSDVPIIQALQRGVRVIELDLWPTPNKDDVHVLHGRTLTSPVKLMKCLKSIKEHAFCTSPYPVILTLEDHLTPDLQAKVAQMVTEIFGEMLYYPESERMKEFPSPEELKYKIVISTKPPKEYLQVKSFSDEGSMSEKKNVDPFEGAPADAGPSPGAQDKYDKMEGDLETIEKQGEGDDDADELFDAKWQQSSVLAYKRLITIPAVPRGKLEESLKDDPNTVKRLSWSEQLLEKATTSYGPDVVRFTQKNILRTFPKITRFNSSNYNPFVGWMHGAQMVAFNMQGHGRSLWLMQGMFRANGGCGYIKKPDFLMNLCPDNQAFDPKSKLPVKTSLKVKIYMGDGWQKDFKPTHFDLYSPPDFYTKIGIAGVGEEETMKKTKIKEDEWVPVWEEEFKFGLRVPELAVLRVEVHEYDMSEKDDFAGQTCLPVSHLRSGFRAVPLFDRKGDPYPSVKLFMRFAFE